jgi:hypothetical protein
MAEGIHVVQLSTTPLSGLPYRIARAIGDHTPLVSRAICTNSRYGNRCFPHDLIWSEKDEECQRVLEESHIYVLHSYFDVDSPPYRIRKYLRSNSRVTAHYCVEEAQGNRALIAQGIPTTVSAQYHTRFYPRSHVMPNIMPIDDEAYRPVEREWPPDVPLRVAFSPSNKNTREQAMKAQGRRRWSWKGRDETLEVLEDLKEKWGAKLEIELLENLPLDRCMARRAECHVSIDEVVTGSYHNVHLEGMSQGLISVVYMDDRTLRAMGQVVGKEALEEPAWINTSIQELRGSLEGLLEQPEGVRPQAEACRRWIERHWRDDVFARRYADFWLRLPSYLQTTSGL